MRLEENIPFILKNDLKSTKNSIESKEESYSDCDSRAGFVSAFISKLATEMQESMVHVPMYISFAASTASVCGFSSFCIINKIHLERGAMNAYSSYYAVYRRKKNNHSDQFIFPICFFPPKFSNCFIENVPSQIQIDH